MGDAHEQRTLLSKAVDLGLVPFRKATSKPAQRAYLGTFLLFLASLLLLGVSSVAYVLFYYSYIPQIGVERPIHLQFGNGHPHGSAHLSSSLVSSQPYDVFISLQLPRTPANVAMGNFMVEVTLLAPDQQGSNPVERIQTTLNAANGSAQVLARSRRPAILTYNSPIVDTANILSNLPWFVLGWKRESERLDINMLEGVEFARGAKNIPDHIQTTIESGDTMHFYSAKVMIRARFKGLRWIMYNYRILSFIFFTSTFFSLSMTSASVVYLLFSFYTLSSNQVKHEEEGQVKQEHSDEDLGPRNPLSTAELSDTPRTFPRVGRQRPLQFFRRPEEEAMVKEEEIEDTTAIQPLVAEADDEDELDFDDGWRDSGIGTGRDDRIRQSMQRRRRSS